jgi:hypothetical protein
VKCSKCGKPDAKRDRKVIAMGNSHWLAFCSDACRDEWNENHRQFVKTQNERDPFRPR